MLHSDLESINTINVSRFLDYNNLSKKTVLNFNWLDSSSVEFCKNSSKNLILLIRSEKVNPTIDILKAHKSIRKFMAKPINLNILRTILRRDNRL